MAKTTAPVIPLPELQVDFAACLAAARKAYLIDALLSTVGLLDVRKLDSQLARFVPADHMRALASVGLRAELVFPVPLVLEANPRILSYYRLLLGHSQKAFYGGDFGTSSFRCMEFAGTLPRQGQIEGLCHALVKGLCALLDGIGVEFVTRKLLDDLTLLTLGPQFRGGANVKKGATGIRAVFELIQTLVGQAVTKVSENQLQLVNAAGRQVVIQFASDPDIVIHEVIGKGTIRNMIAIEVKGGTDFSNIHNRIGEAEKSHQKARQAGYVECWTIVNVHKMNDAMAKRESPSTNRFFRLAELLRDSAESVEFQNHLLALTGLASPKQGKDASRATPKKQVAPKSRFRMGKREVSGI